VGGTARAVPGKVNLQHRWGFVLGVLTALTVLLFAPANAAAADPVIYAAGDIACAPGASQTSTTCHERQTSDIVIAGGAAKALALGDLQYDSASLSNLQNSYNNTWGRIKSITDPVLGNHEGSGSGYWDYFYGSGVSNGPYGVRNKGWYSFNVGAWHLIGINSNCTRVACTAGSEQEQWLRADLAANPTSCTLAYWHHPRWSSGHDGDNTFMQPIWQALYDANADLALVGHSHNYERYAPQDANGSLDNSRGIREFVVGTGGAFFTGVSSAKPNSEVRNNTTYGVLKVTLHPTSFDWQFVPEAGKTFTDSGTQACHGSGGAPPPPADTQSPTLPGTLTATAPGATQVNLSWGASTDNIGVTGYEIYRNGSLLTTKNGTTTTHTDTPVSGNTTYTYQVRAVDAAGNRSAFGNSVAVTTPAGSTVKVSPDADAQVQEASPTTNLGTGTYLRADGGTDPDVESYLKFTVSGLPGAVQSAKLRVYAYTGTVDGPAVYTTPTDWSESTINWNTKPGPTSAATDDKTSIGSNTWVEYDVTPLVTGNGTYGFRLAQTSTDGVDIRSREYTDATLRPELLLTVGGGGDVQPPTTPSSLTGTATSPTRVDLSWTSSTDNVGVAGYDVFRNGAMLVSTTGTGTTFSDTTAAASTTYNYQVRARDAAGNRSGFSNTVPVTTPSPVDTQAPTVPASLTATSSGPTQVNVSWGTSTDNVGVTGYEIFRDGTLLVTKTGTTHTDTPVSPGTTYAYQVRALDAAGNRSAFGNTATVTTPVPDTQPPSIPGTLTATATSSTQVDLSWGASTDNVSVTGYEVLRNGTLLVTKTGTTHTDAPVSPGTTYTYQVRALDAAGNRSAFGNSMALTTPNITTLKLAPDADARVSQSSPTSNYGATNYIRTDGGTDPPVESYVTFTVSGLAGAVQTAKLRIYAYSGTVDGPAIYATGSSWSETAINWNNKPAATSAAADDKGAIATNSWVEYNVAPFITGNGTYSFRLATTSTDGVDIRSREYTDATLRPELVVTAIAPDTQAPTVPANLSGSAVSPTQVNLSWTASTDNVGVTGYEVFRDGSLIAGTSGTGTSFADTNASPSTTHGYQVRALDAAGNRSALGNTATVTTPTPVDATPPTAPSNLSGTAASPTRVNLSWTPSTDNVGVTGYELFRDGALLAATGTGTTFSDTTASPSTTHSYQVRALDAANNHSAFSNTATVTTPTPPDAQPPTDPAGLTAAAASPTRVDLSWTGSTDNVGVTGYEVFRDGALLGTATGTSFTDTSASPSTTHSYQVRAHDAAGNRSGFSNTATVTTPAPPDTQAPTPPSDLSATASSPTQVDLSWTASNDNVGVTGYEVFRNGTYLATATFTSFSDTTASASTPYTYEVRALDAAGNRSGFSNSAVVITPAPPDTEAPSAPTNLTGIAASPTQVDLSWTASTDNVGVAGYEVYRDGSLLATTTGTGTGYSDTSASPSSTHTYRVRALDAAGNHSGFSNTATVTTPAPPDTEPPTVPANLTATASGPTQIDVAWNASTDNVAVAQYEVYRDGVSLGAASGIGYVDTTVSEATTYSYRVRASDTAGNNSGLSDPATVTTPAAVRTATFTADADARVEEANAFSNFGSDDLGADGGTDPAVESYLRFSVSGISGAVQSAKLRVFAYSDTVDGPAAYTSTGNWSESGLFGITWVNRPVRTSTPIDDKAAIAASSWVEYDVTQLVNGDGTYDFVLATTSEDEVAFFSHEQLSFAPELVVTY
jgi:chitodextrinase